ncbi:hypothetical protein [Nonomuraea diastatica]|uniref:Lactococcin 972 family bacteriocin n=1 Tax=Nonomuraea diastatica TaxID=1848329 RepID=A0A4R4X2C5_9ACTN|nr:hypothetical protein [Nonomuraea diastatica]TDD24339.1 hypothetical protein E1294_06255 [Nonomuraea diastatica]
MAVTGLALTPAAAQASTHSTTSWGKFFSGDGGAYTFNKAWDGKVAGAWNGRGIKKVYTFTCWAGKFDNCGKKYRIY